MLPEPERRTFIRLTLRVLAEPMVLLLIVAALIYAAVGDRNESLLLAGSVLVVTALTLYQEHRAEHALRALRDMGSPRAHVIRDGVRKVIPAREVVEGDLIAVGEGDRVPADANLLECVALQLDESLLTGESAPVDKRVEGAPEEARIFAHTLVVRGHGLATVSAVGGRTAVGRIGASLSAIPPEQTPLQLEMRRVVLLFAMLSLASCTVMILGYGWTRHDWSQAWLAGITLAIATIPEEFPVVLAVFLAAGAWRLAQQKALVRRSAAIEALGAITVLCTDKTGTITRNRMEVARVVAQPATGTEIGAEKEVIVTGALACPSDSHDPMDMALRSSASAQVLSHAGVHVHEYPLTSALPATAHVWRSEDGILLACKGAPESVAMLCGLSAEEKAEWLQSAATLASQGLRVLAVASTQWQTDDPAGQTLPERLTDLTLDWRGLIGFADPLREGIRDAVQTARSAGVRVVMLTGDHLETAKAIAGQAGLDAARSSTGDELERLESADRERVVMDTDVFARIKPEQKLRLVQSLKQQGQIVGMTGDGVNDAPALMAAHVGIAMGQRGTDVAREASEIVLLDDDFSTIVRTIGQGRTIYDNIQRAMRYILAVHIPITGLALLPLFHRDALVLLPIHVVFLELIIDPACAFVFEREPPAADVMQRPARGMHARLMTLRMLMQSLVAGAVMFATVLAVYLAAEWQGLAGGQVRSLAFSALVAGNLGLIVLYRSGATVLSTLRTRNRSFWVVAIAAIVLLMLVTRTDAVAAAFGFLAPPWFEWWLALVAPLTVVAVLHRIQRYVAAPKTTEPRAASDRGC